MSIRLSGYASFVKHYYLLSRSIYLGDKRVENDFPILNRVSNFLIGNAVTGEQFRELARTDPWRGYWSICKENVFGKCPTQLTEDQRILSGFSRMYDSIYESCDVPQDEIIDCDDALDGWMIKQKRERLKSQNSKIIEKMTGNVKGDEVFLIAKNKQHAKKINEMNDTSARIIKRQRESLVKRKGLAVDMEFADKQLEMAAKKK